MSVTKLFKGNECFSVAVYYNCMAEKNAHFTEALLIINYMRLNFAQNFRTN